MVAKKNSKDNENSILTSRKLVWLRLAETFEALVMGDKYMGDHVYSLSGVSTVGASLTACTHLAAVAPVIDVSAVGPLHKIH